MASLVVAAFAVIGVAAPASAAPADTIYALVNQARAAHGLRGFLANQSMDAVALGWANQMNANAAMSHNPGYSAQIPTGWSRAGENVAAGYPTAQAMFDGWMKSPGHRANILGDFTDIGIAFISVNGQTWGVQDFGKYPGHVGPAAPAAPAPVVPVPAPAPVVPTTAPVPSATPTPLAAVPSPGAKASPAASGAPTSADSGIGRPAGEISGALAVLAASSLVVVLAVGLLLALWRRRARAGEGSRASRGSRTLVQEVD